MTPRDARKLLGGYATGTLTPAEQEALFAAALDDQALFDELAREQGLREALNDPAAKARLLAALDDPPRRWWQSWRPWVAVAAMAGVGVLAVSLRKPPAPPVEVATARVEAPRPVAPPTPAEVAPAAAKAPGPTVRRKPAASPPAAPEAKAEDTKVRLTAAATAVEQRAADNAAPVPSPTPARFQATLARTGAAAQLGLRCVLLRSDDSVSIRFTSIVNGYLSVGGATPVLLTANQPYTSPALTAGEVKIVFARQPQTEASTTVMPEEAGAETYVVNAIGADAVAFTLPLRQP